MNVFPSQNIDELLKDIRENKAIALFLGAGTDITSVYPDNTEYDKLRKGLNPELDNPSVKLTWENLLAELIDAACIEEEEIKSLKGLTSSPLKAAILKNRMGDSYIPIIQNWLYARCNRKTLLDSYEYFNKYKKNPSVVNLKKVPFGTLFVIADLILRQKSVRAVITQNYNNFLSEAIRILLEKDGNSYCESRRDLNPLDVYSGWKEESNNENSFFIYHIHGFIPPPSEMLPAIDSNHIVLSDEEFYQLSQNVFSWQNASQLHFLTHHTCIILGLSLDDMTTARLLRHANIENNSEKVYWLRGGPNDDSDEVKSKLKAEYYESQHLCVVNDADGYADLYHKMLIELTDNGR